MDRILETHDQMLKQTRVELSELRTLVVELHNQMLEQTRVELSELRSLVVDLMDKERNRPSEIKHGTKYWTNDRGEPHRDNDLPAIVNVRGDQFWYQNGKLHRSASVDASSANPQSGKPAAIYANGDQLWYQDGKIHRADDQPAIVRANGEQEWWVDGNCIKKFVLTTI